MNPSRAASSFQFRLPIGVALVGLLLGPVRGARAQSAPADPLACVPTCRTGYMCWKGQCISACNPVCGPNETCTSGGECVPKAAALASVAAPVPVATPVPLAPVVVATAPAPFLAPAPPAPVADSPSSPAASAAKPSSGAHRHNGFYMRFGLGLAGASSATDATSSNVAINGGGIDVSSFAVPLELAIGGTPAPGFVIGVGSYGSIWPTPHATLKNFGRSFESDAGPVVVSSLGPFVDYYFDPEKGLHGQFGVAFASASAARSTDSGVAVRVPSQDFAGKGWSAMGGFGWESWIGQEWSMGILGRLQYGELALESTSNSIDKMPTRFLVVGALASITYH
jgi:hypothetical protein